MTVSLGKNIAALQTIRQLGKGTDAVSSSLEKLSSGLRINHASDDAAGLSISQSLNLKSRVYNQGVRNVNDGASALNIAAGGLASLENITIRQMELAEQAANGALSYKQRVSLNKEATALTSEYNRIVQSTQFNGIGLLDINAVSSGLNIQSGFGSSGNTKLSLDSALARIVGNGTLGTAGSGGSGAAETTVVTLNDVTGGSSTKELSHIEITDTSLIASGDWFQVSDENASFNFWFNVDGQGGDPFGGAGIEIDINSTDTTSDVALAVSNAITGTAIDASASPTGSGVDIQFNVTGNIADIAKPSSNETATISIGFPEDANLPSGISNGAYITLSEGSTDYYIWFNVDGAGSDPGLSGTAFEVDITSSTTGTDVATAIISAFNATVGFAGGSLYERIDLSFAGPGNWTDIHTNSGKIFANVTSQGAGGGYSVSVTDQGSDGSGANIIDIINPGDYIKLNNAATDHYFWFSIEGIGSDPGAGGTAHEVALSSTDDLAAVVAALQNAIQSSGAQFGVSVVGSVLTITNTNPGDATDITSNLDSSIYNASVSQQGSASSTGYSASSTISTGGANIEIASGDFNGDGKVDLVTSNFSSTISILLGNGNGTFRAATNFNTGGSTNGGVSVGDFNDDGKLDIISANSGSISIFIGNGNGSFQTAKTMSGLVYSISPHVTIGDVNNDGKDDLLVTSGATGSALYLGNGNGTFQAMKTIASGAVSSSGILADFNGDGNLDIAVSNYANGQTVLLGNGNGTFRTGISIGNYTSSYELRAADINNDGVQDLVLAGTSVGFYIGNGNGTFRSISTFALPASGQAESFSVEDIDSDGNMDILVGESSNNVLSVIRGNGNGTFKAGITAPVGNDRALGLTVADFNNDGGLDVGVSNFGEGTISLFLANSGRISTITNIDLTSRKGALGAIGTLQNQLNRITGELGNIGSYQSRLASNLRTVQSTADNYLAAKSRITDVDVASESSQLVRTTILQKTQTALLGQANQNSQIVLDLLKNIGFKGR